MAIKVLVVDDQEDIRLLMRVVIDAANHGLVVGGTACTGHEALDLLDALDPTVIVLDQMMPQMNGFEVARAILERRPGQRILMCSAYLDEEMRVKASETGIIACLSKEDVALLPDAVRQVAASA